MTTERARLVPPGGGIGTETDRSREINVNPLRLQRGKLRTKIDEYGIIIELQLVGDDKTGVRTYPKREKARLVRDGRSLTPLVPLCGALTLLVRRLKTIAIALLSGPCTCAGGGISHSSCVRVFFVTEF